ncbi:hypothetical protein LTR78_001069 [Recurvomyces mirabilis]|uniref:Zn(2)-C6 fungal-type domain-containing protein n=1 Tax=Recurvomyces mirabilis TaxID=574656 RepID=A0AAE1C635_9PEZI|nr:hypothetical protein LTR78_001069 [Recurvomyces mirabilis]KAK5159041.1 hypothetical protein LTS14_003149 [Recurvomyces mirabilis]
MAPKMVFKRRCKTRVRSGCITCKARRVKCGEQHPKCDQCVSRGLICAGYELHLVPFETTSWRSRLPLLQLVPRTERMERKLFANFVQRGEHVTNGIIDNGPLHIILCQAAQTEPVIWHGIIALEASQEHESHYALNQYGTVLRTLSRRIENLQQLDRGSGLVVPLLTCLLCIPFELLHARVQAATSHLEGAMAVLQLLKRDADVVGFGSSLFPLQELREAFEELYCQHSMYTPDEVSLIVVSQSRITSQPIASTIDGESARGKIATPRTDFDRSALEELRDYSARGLRGLGSHRRFFILVARSMIALRARVHEVGIDMEFLIAQKQIMNVLSLWANAMQYHFSRNLALEQQQRLRKYSMFYYQAKIMLSAVMHLSGSAQHASAHIKHVDDFQRIVDLAHTAVLVTTAASTHAGNVEADFGLHVGAIQPLHFTATKCPDPEIKHDALHLLRGPYARREGWWSGKRAADSAILDAEQG